MAFSVPCFAIGLLVLSSKADKLSHSWPTGEWTTACHQSHSHTATVGPRWVWKRGLTQSRMLSSRQWNGLTFVVIMGSHWTLPSSHSRDVLRNLQALRLRPPLWGPALATLTPFETSPPHVTSLMSAAGLDWSTKFLTPSPLLSACCPFGTFWNLAPAFSGQLACRNSLRRPSLSSSMRYTWVSRSSTWASQLALPPTGARMVSDSGCFRSTAHVPHPSHSAARLAGESHW